jgi:hypothetical protein
MRARRHAGPVVAARRAGVTSSRQIANAVRAILKEPVEEGCDRALSNLTRALGVTVLFPKTDPSSALARRGIRAMVEELTRGLTRVAVAALLLPSPREWPPRSFPRRRSKLTTFV